MKAGSKKTECENIWDFEKETVTADITLYAKWTEDPTAAVYTVSFELQEHGTPIESLTVKTGELLTAPEAPTADGYQFEGWFKEPECTNAWDFAIDTVLSDTILYANGQKEKQKLKPPTQQTLVLLLSICRELVRKSIL